MPADEEKTTVEVGNEQATQEAPGKGSKKLFLYGGIGLALVMVGVVVMMFVVRPMMSKTGEGNRADDAAAVESSDHGAKTSKSESSHKPTSKPKQHGPNDGSASVVYAIKDIVVNPSGTGGSRFLSVSFGFELSSQTAAADFESREMIVRDALITILSSKTVAQLTDFKQKEIIRYQIKKRLEKILETDELEGVYYTDFVLQ